MIDLEQLLHDRGIDYVAEGRNVRRGWLGICCPWCGEEDKSYHLGLDPATGRYACWRNHTHCGGTPHGLLMKLLGCPWEAVNSLLNEGERSQLYERVTQSLSEKKEIASNVLSNPSCPREPGLEPISIDNPMHARFVAYLVKRGYKIDDIPALVDEYGLRCALYGRFTNRVVFPINEDMVRLGWVGRAIDDAKLRYLSLPGAATKRTIWRYDWAKDGGDLLWVCEGPFDAMRMDYMSPNLQHAATCIFGLLYTPEQLAKLYELCGVWKEVRVLFDSDAVGMTMAMNLVRRLGQPNVWFKMLPNGVHDPAELSEEQVAKLIEE